MCVPKNGVPEAASRDVDGPVLCVVYAKLRMPSTFVTVGAIQPKPWQRHIRCKYQVQALSASENRMIGDQLDVPHQRRLPTQIIACSQTKDVD